MSQLNGFCPMKKPSEWSEDESVTVYLILQEWLILAQQSAARSVLPADNGLYDTMSLVSDLIGEK